jgi:V-type H+-transporting ATPase subunit G
MESEAGKTGIQTLLEAEKEASKIVQKAKLYRTQRLKDARLDAQQEIEKMKQKKQEEFKAYELKVFNSN